MLKARMSKGTADLKTLTVPEVLEVHEVLVRDFAATGDPISPPGVRSKDLLESAVARQHAGLGTTLKYPEPLENAATLLYGICCDHPFHNGNKRTALVAALAHLDRNRLALYGATQHDLYDLMIKVAEHSIGIRRRKKHANKPLPRRRPDDEVRLIAEWLEPRTNRVARGERKITYRQLRKILENFGYRLENPESNMIDVCRYAEVERGFFKKRKEQVRIRLGRIGWPGDNRDMSLNDLRRIRELCSLREEDGVDSDAFYSYATVLDTFVNRYRKVLRALSKV
jgi:death-on-curing protein